MLHGVSGDLFVIFQGPANQDMIYTTEVIIRILLLSLIINSSNGNAQGVLLERFNIGRTLFGIYKQC
jgi:hypothetical protein